MVMKKIMPAKKRKMPHLKEHNMLKYLHSTDVYKIAQDNLKTAKPYSLASIARSCSSIPFLLSMLFRSQPDHKCQGNCFLCIRSHLPCQPISGGYSLDRETLDQKNSACLPLEVSLRLSNHKGEGQVDHGCQALACRPGFQGLHF